MSQISNDEQFKQKLQGLDAVQQRIVAAMFVEHVISLCSDERINSVIKVASNSNASEDEISNALRSAKAATIAVSNVLAKPASSRNFDC